MIRSVPPPGHRAPGNFFHFQNVNLLFYRFSQQAVQACPCVSGYVCEQTTTSTTWGKC